ncbi:MAG: MmgE/PrpD family protein [Burkholderiaceae bacterium]
MNTATTLATGSISEQYAQWACNLQWADVPTDTLLQAKHLVLDGLGIALASGNYPYARQTLAAAQELCSGEGLVPVIGLHTQLPARDAALVNGLLVHGLDYDDTHAGSVVHATASVFPAAFSMACQQDRTGRELLLAYVAGMEVATRVGLVAGGIFHKAGFHPTSLAGIFGCVIAAARLRGLTVEQTIHAQGIALSMAGGTLEFLQDGAGTKRLHPGWAASSAIAAVTLAHKGMTGPRAAYEGRFGLYASHLGAAQSQCNMALATQGLGQEWEIHRVAVKPIPACHFVHACVDAASALSPAWTSGTVRRVVARVAEGYMPVVCEPVTQKRRPSNSYEAQFSMHYAVATALRFGKFSLEALEQRSMDDPQTLQIADLVTCEVDPDADYPKYFPGEVVLEFEDGRRLAHKEPINRGAPGRPIEHNEIVRKFMDNATLVWSASDSDRLACTVLQLDHHSSRELAQILGS